MCSMSMGSCSVHAEMRYNFTQLQILVMIHTRDGLSMIRSLPIRIL